MPPVRKAVMRTRRGGSVTVDRKILRQIARGDKRAFAAAYDEVAPQVFAVAQLIVGDPRVASAVTEGVVCELWRCAPRLSMSHERVGGWIARASHRVAKQFMPHTGNHDADSTVPLGYVIAYTRLGGFTYHETAAALSASPSDTLRWMREGLRKV